MQYLFVKCCVEKRHGQYVVQDVYLLRGPGHFARRTSFTKYNQSSKRSRCWNTALSEILWKSWFASEVLSQVLQQMCQQPTLPWRSWPTFSSDLTPIGKSWSVGPYIWVMTCVLPRQCLAGECSAGQQEVVFRLHHLVFKLQRQSTNHSLFYVKSASCHCATSWKMSHIIPLT